MTPIAIKSVLTAAALGAIGGAAGVPDAPMWLRVVLSGVSGLLIGWAHIAQPGAKVTP